MTPDRDDARDPVPEADWKVAAMTPEELARDFAEDFYLDDRECRALAALIRDRDAVVRADAYAAGLRAEPDRTQSGITLTANGVEVPVNDDARVETWVDRRDRRWRSIQCSLPEPASIVVVHGLTGEPITFEGRTTAGDPHSTHAPYRFKGEARQ